MEHPAARKLPTIQLERETRYKQTKTQKNRKKGTDATICHFLTVRSKKYTILPNSKRASDSDVMDARLVSCSSVNRDSSGTSNGEWAARPREKIKMEDKLDKKGGNSDVGERKIKWQKN